MTVAATAADLDRVAARRRRDTALRTRVAPVVLMLVPALVLFTTFVILPMGEAGFYSLFKWNGYGSPQDFVGLRNFELLLRNRTFWSALTNTGLIILVSLAVQLPLALAMALLLAEKLRGRVAFRMVFFLPYILAEVATGLIWQFLYDGRYGAVALIWSWFGSGAEAPFVLADRDLAMAAVLLLVVWKYFGFHMMIYIAGLQNIPHEIVDAARIDGASSWQIVRRIKIPMLFPTIRLTVFFAVVGALQLFDMVMALTRGGPSNSTHSLVTYLYTFGQMRMEIGFGSAVGVVLFLICVTFSLVYRGTLMRGD
ncbi:carbohydrate ABC transporter permease [Inquilinus limosus]|uniref:carbohydrate ABC transporter permease n=1 Tax=Inquilinus limosus TaxID=171674 RepID=UPI0004071317|nr:sugar ABC transporter permease [Inquilinus limosus]